MVPDLFYQSESGVFIEVVPWEGKVVVEGSSRGVCNIVAMGVYPKIRWWFAFANVLCVFTQNTVAQVYDISTFTVQVVQYFESFTSGVTGEGLCGYQVFTA